MVGKEQIRDTGDRGRETKNMQRCKTGVRGRDTGSRAVRQGKEDGRHRYLDEKRCSYCRTLVQFSQFIFSGHQKLKEWGLKKDQKM